MSEAPRVPLLLERIRGAIASDPSAPAFLGGATLSYSHMRALVGATMAFLQEKGVRPGQVVSLTMPQTPLHVITFLALARMGAISLSVSPIARESERDALYRRFGVSAAISELETMGAPGVPLIALKSIGAKGNEAEFDSWPFQPVDSTPMRIALTSGTVGEQKGIEQTHGQFALRLDRRFYGEAPRPRAIPPNLHVTASLTLACHALTNGGALVFPPGYDAQSLFVAIARFGVTHLTMPPAHVATMLPLLDVTEPAFPGVKHLRLLGATPTPALLDEIRRKLTPNVFVPYATAELGVISIATPEILAVAPASSGRVCADAQVQVRGSDGSILPMGQAGELLLRVPGMPLGYFGGADPERFRDGWFHPRDYGYLGPDGLLYVQGRIDEVINLGGRKLAPTYAESILEERGDVREAAVFPIEGMAVAALVVARGPVDWRALDAFAQKRLKVFAPQRYYEVGEIPRNVMGKIARRELAALAESDRATLRHPA